MASPLLNLPEDVRIRILLVLDFVSLLRCKTLCRGIRDAINNTIEIEYKLALARAGKVQLGQSRLCIADRLQALRNTSDTTAAAPSLDTLPFISLPDEVVPHWPDVTDGFTPHLTNYRTDLVLWRPVLNPGPRGARKERLSIPAVMSHLSGDSFRVPPAVMCALAVDVAQDLLVFSRPARPEISPAECYVHSISEGGPHPNAGGLRPFRIPFHSVISEDGRGTVEDLQIFGDVIAWSVTDHQHSAAYVWNWKTSVLLWHYESRTRGSSCRVISSDHVVLVTAQSLSVYKFDEFTQHAPPPASLATALSVLELPRLNASRFAPYVRAYMQFPPSAPSRDASDRQAAAGVAFGLDPAQTVLAVTLLQSTDVDPDFRLRLDPEDRNVSERYAIFVPLATLFKFTCSMLLRAGTDTDTTQTQAWARRRTVPWAQWGPGGTRIVRFEYMSHVSVMGSRCAFMLYDRHGAGKLHTVLFDVRRGARDNSNIARERFENGNLDDDDSASELVDVREVLAENLSFAEEVRTTFPIKVVHKAHPGWSAGFLLEDCVAISQQLRVTHPGVGYQGYDPINWL